MTAPTEEQSIQRDLATAATLVHSAREALANGQAADLSDLERRIDGTCRALAGLPRDRARHFEAPLTALIDELDKLSSLLTERHQALEGELDGLGQRRRAVAAYGKAEGR